MHVLLSTDYDPSQPLDTAELGDGSVVVCHVEELPLKPGRYTVSATIQRAGGEIVDRVGDTGFFTILPSDFFGTGIFAGDTHSAPVLVRHRWDVLPPPRRQSASRRERRSGDDAPRDSVSQRRRDRAQRRPRRQSALPDAAVRERADRTVRPAPPLGGARPRRVEPTRGPAAARGGARVAGERGLVRRADRRGSARAAHAARARRPAAAVPDDRQERRHPACPRQVRARDEHRHPLPGRAGGVPRPGGARPGAGLPRRPRRRPGRDRPGVVDGRAAALLPGASDPRQLLRLDPRPADR